MKNCHENIQIYENTNKQSVVGGIRTKVKKFIVIYLSIVLLVYSFVLPKAEAITNPVGHLPVSISASIGQYYISLSGFIAPFASVVLTTDNSIMRSTAADSKGYFSISQVLVKQGFDHFCLTAVDVKRLGQSEACFKIPVVKKDFIRENIFLPPTIGLFRTEIQVGSSAIIWGYSMPGAIVSVHSSDGKVYNATADKEGFYQISAVIANAGSYDLSATATLNKQNSEKPSNKVTLIALTLAEQVNKSAVNWLKNLLTFLFNLPLGPLWLALPIIILIFILLRKLHNKPLLPSLKPSFGKEKLFFDYLFRKRKLHHSWMKGIGY